MTERVIIVVEARGTGRTERSIRRVGAASRRTGADVNFLRSALLGISAGAAVREFGQLLDATTRIDNRLSLLTSTQSEVNQLFDGLSGVARNTRSGLEPTVDLFSRLARSTKALQLSQNELLGLTTGVNQAFRIYGNTAAEAEAATIQFSQGLAAGALRGDELRSVLEQAPRLAQALADGLTDIGAFGEGVVVGIGDLRELGKQGVLTADLLAQALGTQLDELNEEFRKTSPTIEDSITIIRNSAIELARDFNETTNFSEKLSRALIFVGDNLEEIVRVLAAGTIVLGLRAITFAIGRLTAAIAANPIGLLATALAVGTSALITFGDQITLTSDSTTTILDLLAVTFEGFGNFVKDSLNFIIGAFTNFQAGLDDLDIEQLVLRFGTGLDTIRALFVATFNSIKNFLINILAELGEPVANFFNSLKGGFEDFATGLNAIGRAVTGQEIDETVLVRFGPDFKARFQNTGRESGEVFAQAFVEEYQKGTGLAFAQSRIDAANARAAAREEARRISEASPTNPNFNAPPREGERVEDALRAKDIAEDRLSIISQTLTDLQEEQRLLGLTGVEREVLATQLKAEESLRNRLRQANRSAAEEEIVAAARLSDAEKERIETIVRENAILNERQEAINSLTDQEDELIKRQTVLNQLIAEQADNVLPRYIVALEEVGLQLAKLRVENGEGSFFDGFRIGLGNTIEGFRGFAAETGEIFGGVFSQLNDGFADTLGKAVVQGEDLEESLKAVARTALTELVSSLIKVGIQQAANFALGQSLQATATASTAAQMGAVAAAAAPAAAAVTAATAGANIPAATIGLGTIAATAAALFAGAGVLGAFRDGGEIGGIGTGTSDSNLIRASRGEFMVNAEAYRNNRDLVREINANGRAGPVDRNSGTTVINQFTINTPDADSFRQSRGQIEAEMQAAASRAFDRRN